MTLSFRIMKLNIMRKCSLALILTAATFASAYANLSFEYTSLKENASPLESEFCFLFPFENNSKIPVEIKKISPSCSCVLYEMKKKIYLPGEKGILFGKMDISGKSGNLRQSVLIETNSLKSPTIKLEINLCVPPIATIKPSLLFWSVGEAAAPKSALVVLNPDFANTISGIELDGDGISANIVQDSSDEFKFEISVAPQSTNKPLRRLVSFNASAPDGTLKKHFIHAIVK